MAKPISSVSIEEFKRDPVWEYDLKYEDAPGRDETWANPVGDLPVSDLGNRVVGTSVRLANGQTVFATLSNVSLNNARSTEHFLFLSIMKSDGSVFHLSRYHDSDHKQNGPSALADYLGLPLKDVFPLEYDISDIAVGLPEVLSRQVNATPAERLSREALMKLAMKA